MMVDEMKGIDAERLRRVVGALEVRGDLRGEVVDVTCDSRAVKPGFLFVAVRGASFDGHAFVRDAAGAGAACAVVEEGRDLAADLPLIVVRDSRVALGLAAAEVHDHPSRKLSLFGVTGTNGKTTVAFLFSSVLEFSAVHCGVIGTVEYRWKNRRVPAVNTTPSSDAIHRYLALMAEDGVAAAALEVSSHGVAQRRLAGLRFRALALTNVTRDHLDYHGSFTEYIGIKERLFRAEGRFDDGVEVGAAVLNIDDLVGRRLAKEIGGRTITFGLSGGADVRGELLGEEPAGTRLSMTYREETVEFLLPLPGVFNASNALAAAALAIHHGFDLARIAAGLAATPPVPGRLERIDRGQPFDVYIDFAHTPDGLLNVLRAVRPSTRGRVICLFGCGGDRDTGKRPSMGRIAGEFADHCILTDDNPRNEDPAEIRRQVEEGLASTGTAYEVIGDRRDAIARAIEIARPGDTVLIAGKGHENAQIVGNEKIPFLDAVVATEALDRMGEGR